jgi:uncharacterized protein (TIGR02147 family)
MPMEVTSVFPLIEKYRDYRKFISDFYQFKKGQRSGFSFRQFSQKAGLKSPNYLQLVMRGDRNLSEDMAEHVGNAMDLTETQCRYFISLVRQENAKSEDELVQAQEASLVALKKLVSKYLRKQEAHVLSEWHYLLVRELVSLSDFEPSGEYISQKLKSLISPQVGERALRVLLETGFLKINKGRWQIVDAVIDTGDTVFTDDLIKKYHSKSLKIWSENLDKWNSKDLELGVLTLSLPSSKVPELKKRMHEFQDQILGWLQNEKNIDSIVQVGVYMIPHVINKNGKD